MHVCNTYAIKYEKYFHKSLDGWMFVEEITLIYKNGYDYGVSLYGGWKCFFFVHFLAVDVYFCKNHELMSF